MVYIQIDGVDYEVSSGTFTDDELGGIIFGLDSAYEVVSNEYNYEYSLIDFIRETLPAFVFIKEAEQRTYVFQA